MRNFMLLIPLSGCYFWQGVLALVSFRLQTHSQN